MKRDRMIIADLSARTVSVEPIRDDLEKNYMAGEGVGTRLVWEMVEPNISAFEPGNTIVFAAGAEGDMSSFDIYSINPDGTEKWF